MYVQVGFKTQVFLISLVKITENGTVRIPLEYYFTSIDRIAGHVPDT